MFTWFENLSLAQQIYTIIAVPSTLLLILQAVLLLFGIGDADADIDAPDDVFSLDDGFVLFSLRGILSMLALGGWSGVAFLETGMQTWIAVLLSLVVGFAALYLSALLMKQMMKLQEDGSIHAENAVGKVGTVYLTVPAAQSGQGKVTLLVQERYTEFNAVTTDETPIRTGESIRVLAANDLGILVVTRESATPETK